MTDHLLWLGAGVFIGASIAVVVMCLLTMTGVDEEDDNEKG